MGNVGNLQEIMNKVSRQLEVAGVAPAPVGVLTELQAFALIDPLLADLNKQYLDARNLRRQSEKDFGVDDAMTEMALLVEDSAWCAVQTRYLEVRAERALMMQAQELMEEARVEEVRAEKVKKERESLDYFHQMEWLARMEERKKGITGPAILLLYLFLMKDQERLFRFHHASYNFNRLAA